MSQSKLSLSVKGYEDIDDGSGNMMTLYIVRVEEASKNVYYVLKKRYTDFSRLYTALKERFPEIEAFRFPNKSIFNTNAQFTKDRRRQGFDDFLKILTTMNPVPTELIEFLEIEQHYRDYYSRQAAVTTTATIVPPNTTVVSNNNSNTSDDNSSNDDIVNDTSNISENTTSRSINNNTETSEHTSNSPTNIPNKSTTHTLKTTSTISSTSKTLESSVRRDQLIELLSSTLIYTTITYILCILLRIIDIRQTTIMKVLLTILALSSVIVLVRYQFLDAKEKLQ